MLNAALIGISTHGPRPTAKSNTSSRPFSPSSKPAAFQGHTRQIIHGQSGPRLHTASIITDLHMVHLIGLFWGQQTQFTSLCLKINMAYSLHITPYIIRVHLIIFWTADLYNMWNIVSGTNRHVFSMHHQYPWWDLFFSTTSIKLFELLFEKRRRLGIDVGREIF